MSTDAPLPLVVALTGASGMPYARRLLEMLAQAGRETHLVLSPAAVQVLAAETDLQLDLDRFEPAQLVPGGGGRFHYHHYLDYGAPVASGSFRTGGMVVCPCSMGTLGSIASGIADNLIHRAADVHLKERRKLVLVPRETPLSAIQLENMARCARAGAVVLPAMPGFYHQPQSVAEVIDFIVARICDHLDVPHSLFTPWGTEPNA